MLEDPAQEPPTDLLLLTNHPTQTPNESEVVVIGFENGTPVSVNGNFATFPLGPAHRPPSPPS